MHAKRFLVSGIVQGVGFRYFMRRAARSFGLRGWVRNLRDGRVEAVAAGPEEALERFIEQVRTGPGGAHVTGLETADAELDPGLEEFEIRY
jgi:acylphosphatase